MPRRVYSSLVLPVSPLKPIMPRPKRTPQKDQEPTPKAPSKRPRSSSKNPRPSKLQRIKNTKAFMDSDVENESERELTILQDTDTSDGEMTGTEREEKPGEKENKDMGDWRKKSAAFAKGLAEMKVVRNQLNLPECATPTKIAVRNEAAPEQTTALSPLSSVSSLPASPDKQMSRFVQFKFSNLELNKSLTASDGKAILDGIKRLEEQMETLIHLQVKSTDNSQNMKEVVEGMLDEMDGQGNVAVILEDRMDCMEDRFTALEKGVAWKKIYLPVVEATASDKILAAEREVVWEKIASPVVEATASDNITVIEKGCQLKDAAANEELTDSSAEK